MPAQTRDDEESTFYKTDRVDDRLYKVDTYRSFSRRFSRELSIAKLILAALIGRREDATRSQLTGRALSRKTLGPKDPMSGVWEEVIGPGVPGVVCNKE